MDKSLALYSLDLLVGALLVLLGLLINLIQQVQQPLALAGGGALHPQFAVELQRLANSRRSVAYWQGVPRHG